MRRFRTRRFSDDMAEDDPLTLVPNIFDLAIVLAIAFLLSALGTRGFQDAVKHSDEWTLIRKSADGQVEVLAKEAGGLKLQKLTPEKAAGKGVRLGSAYQLNDGQVIYVPD